ncbi:response regulator [Larkinella soli]|uniref:response regulator n=1 Tax=Larkinella soli TaxID=1770527 RepID=UPI000FFB13CE|nr:response regulator [Larkinella soli]
MKKTGFLPAVLIIEDDADHRKIIQSMLEQSHPTLQLVFASSDGEALSLLEHWRSAGTFPQLILLDLYLPERETGFQLLQTFKTLPLPVKSVPVVVLSHSNDAQEIWRAYHLGANSFLVKPLQFHDWQQNLQLLVEYWLQTVAVVDPSQSFEGW